MQRTRQQKKTDFDEFYNDSERLFKDLRDKDCRSEKFENDYMLCVCPGSRNGGTEKRIVEVFWGHRQYEFETQGRNWKALTETGATLHFYRNDTGDITITIYPAHTEFRKPIEDSITLHTWLDPKKLKDKSFINSLWNDFMAYMEVTSLDGNPTFGQKIRISYLRNFKHLVIDNKWSSTRFSVFRNEILKYTLTVGLSGFIFYLVSLTNQPKESKTDIQLEETNRKLEKVSNQLDMIIKNDANIKNISLMSDSINMHTAEILTTIEKRKTR